MCVQFWSDKFQTSLRLYILEHLIVKEERVLHLTLVLEDWVHKRIRALDGVPSVCLTNYICSYVIQLYVLFIVSRRYWIYIYLRCLLFHASRDLTIASLDHGNCLR